MKLPITFRVSNITSFDFAQRFSPGFIKTALVSSRDNSKEEYIVRNAE